MSEQLTGVLREVVSLQTGRARPALSTIFDPAWSTGAAFLVSAGAFLFYLSDLILAWNKFVSPLQNSRIYNMLTYHLGQIGLIAGVVSQFSS